MTEVTDSAWNYDHLTISRKSAKTRDRRTRPCETEVDARTRYGVAVRIKLALAVPLLMPRLLFGKRWELPVVIADAVNERRPSFVCQFSPQRPAGGERAAVLDTDQDLVGADRAEPAATSRDHRSWL